MIQQDLITGVRFLGAATFLFVAVFIALAYRGKIQSSVYNNSKWLLVLSSFMLGTQMIIQFVGHFREQSAGLAWTINLAFHIIIVPAINLGERNLLKAGLQVKHAIVDFTIFLLACYALLAIGYFTNTLINDEAPYKTTTFAVAILFTAYLIKLNWKLSYDMKEINTKLNDDEFERRHTALMYTASSIKYMLLASFAIPWMGISSSLMLHSILGIILYGLFLWYLIQFCLYGSNMTEVIHVEDEIFEATEKEMQQDSSVELNALNSETGINELKQKIDNWVKERHYANSNLKMENALRQMDISLNTLNFYLETILNVHGYRQWISFLRIEDAKRFIIEYPNYTLDAIAEMCGFSTRQNLARAFKTHTGMTPTSWSHKQTRNH